MHRLWRRRHGRRRSVGRLIPFALVVSLGQVVGCANCGKQDEPPPAELPAKPMRVEHLKKDLWAHDANAADAATD